MRLFKSVLCLGMSALLGVTLSVGSAHASSATPVLVNVPGKTLAYPALIRDEDVVFVPLRGVSEASGYAIQWSDADQSVTLRKGEQILVISPGDYTYTSNKQEQFMNNPPLLHNGSVFVSTDFASHELGVEYESNQKEITFTPVQQNDLSISVVTEMTDSSALDMRLQYPQLKGWKNADVQTKINETFTKLASEIKASFQELALDYDPDDEYDSQLVVDLDYNIEYNTRNILSVTFSQYEYSGGAHGMTYLFSYTYDLTTGRELSLGELFPKGSDYIHAFNTAIVNQMKERDIYDSQISPFESIAEDQPFYIHNKRAYVYFQQYEIFPYAVGIQSFFIPLSAMP